jgi:RimJ/RimL family protein N-acetyltransferase
MLLEACEDDFADLIAGKAPRGLAIPDSAIAPAPVLHMLSEVAQSVRGTFTPVAWMIVEQGEVVGLCSITKPVECGRIDIGYGIAPTRQGRGIATNAISSVLEWAQNDDRVHAVTAETAIDNLASQRVLEHNGFIRIGERHDDEDGDLYCWKVDFGRIRQLS